MRLTWRRADGAVCPRVEKGTDYHYITGEFMQKVFDKLAAYEDTELTPEEFHEGVAFVLELNKKLKPYMDAEEQGRLVIFPKTLYEADTTPLITGVTEWEVTGVRFYDGVVQAYTVKTKNVQTIIWGREIGKTIFLTHEEAEAALKGEGGDV
jgi:hypothetical protein